MLTVRHTSALQIVVASAAETLKKTRNAKKGEVGGGAGSDGPKLSEYVVSVLPTERQILSNPRYYHVTYN